MLGLAFLLLAPAVITPPLHAASLNHELEVRLDVAASTVDVRDTVTSRGGELPALELASHLEIVSSTPEVTVEKTEAGDGDTLGTQRLLVPAGTESLEIHYRGRYDFGLGDQKEEYTRGFRQTPGLVAPEGVYLASSSRWIPTAEDDFLTFEMKVHGLPAGWHVISQGDGDSNVDAAKEGGNAHWRSEAPMEEVFLVGGPLIRYRDRAGQGEKAVETLAYFRQEEAKLATTYLETTAQYLEMYRRLIGDYPYAKFALIENFWETGYGMPSFTLLGPRVIRFPFILHSSYPHEILHNYWGNGVFVDWQSGNWSEGLTAYLADHLVQEQRGRGAEYRHDTLKRYRNYVQEAEDFPLRDFRSRHDAVTEAIGYGKTLMGFHMLRRSLGERAFAKALQASYADFLGERAAFADWREVFEAQAQEDLGAFFDAWVDEAGAPALSVADVKLGRIGDRYIISGRILNKGALWPLEVPVLVTGTGGESTREVLTMASTDYGFELKFDFEPARLDVDPAFDLFRLLDAKETAASIGTLFGAPEVLAVLPDGERELYAPMIDAWRSGSHEIEAVLASELEALPADRSVWIFGRENPWASKMAEKLGFERSHVVAGETLPAGQASVVEIARHPERPELGVGWLWTEVPAAVPGLIRKLPHYGKYAALGFTGEEPTNVAKARGEATDSPLVVDLRASGARDAPLPARAVEERVALAELPPAFNAGKLSEIVETLAAPGLDGRGLGTEGLDEAARWLAEKFAEIGLEPAGEDGYFQWLETDGPDGPVRTANIVGRRAGSDASKAAVVFGAHYDHLGYGFPDARAGAEGRLHPGADDNASGVAVLLEVAKALSAPSLRDLVVVAFTAEEAGRIGSRHFVESWVESRAKPHSMVNLDTVGRFGERLDVLASDSAEEWPHIVRGVGFVTGVTGRSVPGVEEASDQKSFLDAGVPAVQLFTGAHGDYHRPSDTAEKIDGEDLVKVAVFTREVLAYLLDRPEPLTTRLATAEKVASAEDAAAPRSGRRVRLGTLPDFAFPGPGVKIESVSEGSPAAAAGLQAGDVLLKLGGEKVEDLRGYSNLLRRLEPGQEVAVEVRRGDETLTLEAVLEER